MVHGLSTRLKLVPYLPPPEQHYSKWIKNLNIRPGIWKLIEEKKIPHTGAGEDFLHRTLAAEEIRSIDD